MSTLSTAFAVTVSVLGLLAAWLADRAYNFQWELGRARTQRDEERGEVARLHGVLHRCDRLIVAYQNLERAQVGLTAARRSALSDAHTELVNINGLVKTGCSETAQKLFKEVMERWSNGHWPAVSGAESRVQVARQEIENIQKTGAPR